MGGSALGSSRFLRWDMGLAKIEFMLKLSLWYRQFIHMELKKDQSSYSYLTAVYASPQEQLIGGDVFCLERKKKKGGL